MVKIIVYVGVLGVLLNLASMAWNIVMIRRYYRATQLLGSICVTAFICQNAPIWRAWSRVYGYQFKVQVISHGEED